MACRLVGAKPLSEPMLEYFNWTLRNKFEWNLNRNSHIFIQENAFENVVSNMVTILPRPRCVKSNIYLVVPNWLPTPNWKKKKKVKFMNSLSDAIWLHHNRMAWQWAETLVEIRGTLADIRGTTKLGCRWNFPKHEFNRPVCLEAHHYLLAHLSQ